MIKPPLPADEDLRLAALDSYAILDSNAEGALDGLTRAAALLCDTPIALISLVDRDRQWFLSSVGLDAVETSREVSFCGHAILGEGVFEVADALCDPRFADNPLVTGEPNIRFYAGAPLTTADKFRLGTLCVVDREPRRLTERQRAVLAELSGVAIQLLDQRKAEITNAIRLRDVNRLLDMGEQIAHIGSYQVEGAAREVRWSDGVARICGWSKRDRAPSYAQAAALLHPDDRQAVIACEENARTSGQSASAEARLFRRDGTLRDLQIWFEPHRSADGSLGTVGVVQDITERKDIEREAERDRSRFSALFDTVADGILISEFATGRSLEDKESACRMKG